MSTLGKIAIGVGIAGIIVYSGLKYYISRGRRIL